MPSPQYLFNHVIPPHKRGKPLVYEEKWLIVRIFSRYYDERERAKEESEQAQDARLVDPYQRTSYYTGIGRRQIVEILKHFRETGQVPLPAHVGNRINHATIIPASIEAQIRTFILTQHREGAAVNANHVQDLLQEVLGRIIPKQTIRDHLKRMGFRYSRTKTKPRSLREAPYIRQQRHTFLHEIRFLRQEGYRPVYLDESFLHHYHGNQFSWFSDGDFLERPRGKGRRWCFIHAISEEGLLPNALRIFEAKKSTGDYHAMFNAPHFLEWWQEQLMPNLPGKCVIVADRASFHLIPEEHILPSTMRKAELQEWLSHKNLRWEPHWLRPKLQEEVENHLDKTPLIQKIGEEHGHKVLFLPVHHPELNPIELIWAIVKNECGRLLRKGIKFGEVREHLEESFAKITAETCRKVYEKIRQKEEEYWTLDMELDEDVGIEHLG